MADVSADRVSEMMAVCGASAFLGTIGFLSHTLAIAKELDYRRLVGGMLMAGFTSSISVLLMMASDMNPMVAAPLAAMLGASGEYGFNFVLERYLKNKEG